MKHTTGPWLAWPKGDTEHAPLLVTSQEQMERLREKIADTDLSYVIVPVAQAIAAPDMLAVLLKFQHEAQDCGRSCGVDVTTMDAVNAAITKAKGK